MNNKLIYKNFIASVHFSSDDSVFFGKIESINDLVTFEANSEINLQKAFEEAVDDYVILLKNISFHNQR